MTEAGPITARMVLLTVPCQQHTRRGPQTYAQRNPHAVAKLAVRVGALALNFLVAPVYAVVLTILIPVERLYASGLLLLAALRERLLFQSAHGELGFAVRS